MKTKPTLCKVRLLFCFLLMFLSIQLYAQVGINTDTPNGILDINSSNQGVVLPRLALTATNVMAPATNPQTGSIPIGTAVYNTNITTNGINDVTKGIYSWDGTKWIPQFNQKQSQLYESVTFIRPRSDTNLNISGLTSQSFTAQFTGTYRVHVTVNYGGGGAKVPSLGPDPTTESDGLINIAEQSGTFRFQLDGTNYFIPVHSYSTAYDSSVGGTNYFAIWQQFHTTLYESFTANETVNFTLRFFPNLSPEFISEGNGSTGRAYIAYDIPCSVEFTYIGEQ